MKTISEVLEGRKGLEERMRERNDMSSVTGIHDFVIDGVYVMPDDLVVDLVSTIWRYDTHFVPGRLPMAGMCVGDYLEHEGLKYMTIDLRVAFHNNFMMGRSRVAEPLLVGWDRSREAYGERIESLLLSVSERVPDGELGTAEFRDGEWGETYAGWKYVGSPSPKLIASLESLRDNPQAPDDLRQEAGALVEGLSGYAPLAETLYALRGEVDHKGIPRMDNDLIVLNSPAASGDASWHTQPARDDCDGCLPSDEALLFVGASAGLAAVVHIGAGSAEGSHMTLHAPRTPFFANAQARVDADESLAGIWKEVQASEDHKEASGRWFNETKKHVEAAVLESLPLIPVDTVFGFGVDANGPRGLARVRPVISASCSAGLDEVLASQGLQRFHLPYAGLLGRLSKGYAKLPPCGASSE